MFWFAIFNIGQVSSYSARKYTPMTLTMFHGSAFFKTISLLESSTHAEPIGILINQLNLANWLDWLGFQLIKR